MTDVMMCLAGPTRNLIFSQGGMKTVVWTDVVQGCIMIGGLIAIIILVSLHTI